jgi:FKBP-type peptidyl-prolyl cis-trans isomerase 2
MKKSFLLAWIALTLVLTGCGKTTEVPTSTEQTPQEQVVQQETPVAQDLPLNTTPEMCSTVIKEYLAKADFNGKGDRVVQKWDNVVVHYVWRLGEDQVFDTSVEEVAKWCGTYNAARNYNEGLAFPVGEGKMIAWFDQWVQGMKVGQTKTVIIPAKDAYGEWSIGNIIELQRTDLPAWEYKKGDKLYSAMWPVTVYEVSDTIISLDTNHELAGKTLTFDITVVEIK